MKNYIPLVLAVLLGLAAVLAVGRLLAERKKVQEEQVTVVVAARDIAEGEEMPENALGEKKIPRSARPADAIPAFKKSQVLGQKAKKVIAEGDYVLFSDMGTERSMVGEGEWAVVLNVGNAGIAGLIQPGDEVAVVGTYTREAAVQSADLSAPQQVDKELVTLVLFPRVRVLQTGGGRREDGAQIVVALPPQQAQTLIAAQMQMNITLALRKPGDKSALDRLETGVVDNDTFRKLTDGITHIVLPRAPGVVEKSTMVK